MLHHIKPYFYRRFKTSFSKAGEDIQLWQLLKKEKGTFIDVGGHHPIFGSNSYFFHIRGWRGIVVEPNPVFKTLYKKFRSGDHLFQGGVANFDGELEYFELEGNERNTFSKDHLEDFKLKDKIKTSKNLPVKKLTTICSQFLDCPSTIDFLSVDVEGMEMDVLKSNDWNKFRPKYILLESHQPLINEMESEIYSFLKNQDYQLIGKSLQGHQLGTLWFRANEVIFF